MTLLSTVIAGAWALPRRVALRALAELLAVSGAVALVFPPRAGAALQAAASGGQHGSAGSGFSVFKAYFDKITTYLVYLAVPGTVLMLIGGALCGRWHSADRRVPRAGRGAASLLSVVDGLAGRGRGPSTCSTRRWRCRSPGARPGRALGCARRWWRL